MLTQTSLILAVSMSITNDDCREEKERCEEAKKALLRKLMAPPGAWILVDDVNDEINIMSSYN